MTRFGNRRAICRAVATCLISVYRPTADVRHMSGAMRTTLARSSAEQENITKDVPSPVTVAVEILRDGQGTPFRKITVSKTILTAIL